MGLLDRQAEQTDAETGGRQWRYLARNLHKVAGPAIEHDFEKLGREGWEFVAVAKDYAIFKQPG